MEWFWGLECFGGLGSKGRVWMLWLHPDMPPPFSQQKGIPCHLCQVAVSVMGKILQDNRTEVGGSTEGEWGCCSSLPTPPGP